MKNKAKLTIEIASKMYRSSDESLREFARLNFPELAMKITDRVKTFEDACKITGEDPNSDFFTNPSLRPHEIAGRKVETIVKALRGDWEPDWDNSNEYKYYPWFKRSSSGSGFSSYDYVCVAASSAVGSRQVFPSAELAKYAGQQFTEIYKDMHTL